METQDCTLCGITLPANAEYFYRHKRCKNGLTRTCKACGVKKRKEYVEKNRATVRLSKRKFYRKNKKKIIDKIKAHSQTQQARLLRAAYKERNYEHIKEVRRLYELKRRQTDPQFKLIKTTRNRIRAALKTNYRSKTTNELIGCSPEDLKKYIESMSSQRKTWENHGEWHLDHKIPCASFDLSKPENQKKCFNYKNMQPLWAIDNLKKSDRQWAS